MRLKDIYERPLGEIIKVMDLADMKVHTDEAGNVWSVELKYVAEEKKPGQAYGGLGKEAL